LSARDAGSYVHVTGGIANANARHGVAALKGAHMELGSCVADSNVEDGFHVSDLASKMVLTGKARAIRNHQGFSCGAGAGEVCLCEHVNQDALGSGVPAAAKSAQHPRLCMPVFSW
jgi:hypothetical protein